MSFFNKRVLLKVILLGDPGTGKTALLERFCNDRFKISYKATIGADFMTKDVLVDGRMVTLQVWDTAGQERFRSLGAAFYRGADACILVYDVTNRGSFDALQFWLQEFVNYAGQSTSLRMAIVGNKIDLAEGRQVTSSDARKWCNQRDNQFSDEILPFECSAKELPTSVSTVFEKMAAKALYAQALQQEADVFVPNCVGMDSSLRINASAPQIGLTTGGACDTNNFRLCMEKGIVPKKGSLTVEGLFSEYFFSVDSTRSRCLWSNFWTDRVAQPVAPSSSSPGSHQGSPNKSNTSCLSTTSQTPSTTASLKSASHSSQHSGPHQQPGQGLFSPTYSFGISKNPLTSTNEHWLTIGLSSNLTADTFKRIPLRVMLLLDISGSMNSPLRGAPGSKLEGAKDCLQSFCKLLTKDDYVGLASFHTHSDTLVELGPASSSSHMSTLYAQLAALETGGSTNLSAGIEECVTHISEHPLFKEETGNSGVEYRVVCATDDMVNMGTTTYLYQQITSAALDFSVHCSFIGVGIDFDPATVQGLSTIRGCTYVSVHTLSELRKQLSSNIESICIPVIYDLTVTVQSPNYSIIGVYGNPNADFSTNKYLYTSSLFPSAVNSKSEVKGGVILLKLWRHGKSCGPIVELKNEGRESTVKLQHVSLTPPLATVNTPSDAITPPPMSNAASQGGHRHYCNQSQSESDSHYQEQYQDHDNSYQSQSSLLVNRSFTPGVGCDSQPNSRPVSPQYSHVKKTVHEVAAELNFGDFESKLQQQTPTSDGDDTLQSDENGDEENLHQPEQEEVDRKSTEHSPVVDNVCPAQTKDNSSPSLSQNTDTIIHSNVYDEELDVFTIVAAYRERDNTVHKCTHKVLPSWANKPVVVNSITSPEQPPQQNEFDNSGIQKAVALVHYSETLSNYFWGGGIGLTTVPQVSLAPSSVDPPMSLHEQLQATGVVDAEGSTSPNSSSPTTPNPCTFFLDFAKCVPCNYRDGESIAAPPPEWKDVMSVVVDYLQAEQKTLQDKTFKQEIILLKRLMTWDKEYASTPAADRNVQMNPPQNQARCCR